MFFGRLVTLTALSWTFSSAVQAQTEPSDPATAVTSPSPVAPPAATASSVPSVKATSTSDGARRDPKGKKGMSPFAEAIRRGDNAAVARDYAKAKQAYQDAVSLEPKRALGHYRIGQVAVLAGNLEEAETAYNDALRVADNEPNLHATLLFVLADVKERQQQRDAALKAWLAYSDYLKSEPRAKGYPATAEERKKRLLRYNELLVESKGVQGRVELGKPPRR
jgi:hypothetical protein